MFGKPVQWEGIVSAVEIRLVNGQEEAFFPFAIPQPAGMLLAIAGGVLVWGCGVPQGSSSARSPLAPPLSRGAAEPLC